MGGNANAGTSLGQKIEVFLSAKKEDYPDAKRVYDYLTSHGMSVFFSDQTLPTLGNSDYRDEIDRALDETEHMVVVTTSKNNVESEWVKAEWGFFVNEKRANRKRGNLVTVGAGIKPSDLPPSLRYYEFIELTPFGFERLVNYLRPRVLSTPSPARVNTAEASEVPKPKSQADLEREAREDWRRVAAEKRRIEDEATRRAEDAEIAASNAAQQMAKETEKNLKEAAARMAAIEAAAQKEKATAERKEREAWRREAEQHRKNTAERDPQPEVALYDAFGALIGEKPEANADSRILSGHQLAPEFAVNKPKLDLEPVLNGAEEQSTDETAANNRAETATNEKTKKKIERGAKWFLIACVGIILLNLIGYKLGYWTASWWTLPDGEFVAPHSWKDYGNIVLRTAIAIVPAWLIGSVMCVVLFLIRATIWWCCWIGFAWGYYSYNHGTPGSHASPWFAILNIAVFIWVTAGFEKAMKKDGKMSEVSLDRS